MLHVDEAGARAGRARGSRADRRGRDGSPCVAAEAARGGTAAAAARRGPSAPARLDADLLRRVARRRRAARTRRSRAAAAAAARFDAPAAGAGRRGRDAHTASSARSCADLGAAEVELRQGAEDAAQRATEVEVELARIEADADEARRRLGEAGDEPAEGDDRDELAARSSGSSSGASSSAR